MIRATTVIDAAGSWLRQIAALGSAQVGVVPTRHHVMVAVPLPDVRPNQPVPGSSTPTSTCARRLRAGPPQLDMATAPARFGIADPRFAIEILRALARCVEAQFPVFPGVPLQEHRGGLPTMTTDGEHVLAPAPGVPGRPSMDLSAMSPGRLTTGPLEDDLRERCRLQYGHHYWSPASTPAG